MSVCFWEEQTGMREEGRRVGDVLISPTFPMSPLFCGNGYAWVIMLPLFM
jgi:hypothetical protein